MNFATIQQHVAALSAAVKATDVPKILQSSGDLMHDASAIAAIFIGSPDSVPATSSPELTACLAACDEVSAECKAKAAEIVPNAAHGVAGKIGDGSILKILLENADKIVSIFRLFFGG